MTNKEWKELEDAIGLFSSEKLRVDGYDISIQITRFGKLELRYMVYVNGAFKGKWMSDEENPIRDKFYWRREKLKLPAKFIKDTEKDLGKRWCKKNGIYDKRVYYTPWFKSFSTLKRTFTTNNESIEWVRESD